MTSRPSNSLRQRQKKRNKSKSGSNGSAQRINERLLFVESSVDSFLAEELFVRSCFVEPSAIHHKNSMGASQRRKAMRHHQRCLAGHKFIEGRLNDPLGAAVETRRR